MRPDQQPALNREPLADQVAELLMQRVRAGEWPLGAKLPSEHQLGPQLGVGRSTVREAIRQLAGRGILESRRGSGVFLIAVDDHEDWDAVLRKSGINAVLEARVAIESEAAFLAAERRTPADLRAIRRTLSARHQQHGNLEALVDADTAFHRSVVAAAHNPILVELFDSFVPRVRQAMIELLRIEKQFADAEDRAAHSALAQAIADHDAEAARQLSRTHLASLTLALN